MQFLARSNSNGLDRASWGNSFRQIDEPHARNLRNENLSSMHLLDTADDETHTLLERQPETRHPGIGERDPPQPLLLLKDRDHTTATSNHVPVSRTAKPCFLASRISIRLHQHFLGAELGCSVNIDRIAGLVGAEGQSSPHPLIDRGINHISPAHNVGLNRLKRVVLTGWHLLQSCSVHNYCHSRESPLQA